MSKCAELQGTEASGLEARRGWSITHDVDAAGWNSPDLQENVTVTEPRQTPQVRTIIMMMINIIIDTKVKAMRPICQDRAKASKAVMS